MEFVSAEELVGGIKSFEKNGGEYSSDTHRYRSNDMVIMCRYGLNAVAQFITEAQQTNRNRSIILDGLYAESIEETFFSRDTLIIGENIFDCLQWQEALNSKKVRCIVKNNQTMMDTPITIITKKLLSNYPLANVYYRVFAPFGFKHRLRCMYNYSLTDYCFTENKFIFHEPFPSRNISYYETRMLPIGNVKSQDDFYCSICLDTFEKMYQIRPCKHTMCFSCFEHFNNAKCHMCRGSVLLMSVIYNEDKIIPPYDIKSVLSSLKHLGGIIFSTYLAKPKTTFEMTYLKYLKDTNTLHFCEWPKNEVPRFYGKKLTDLIFIIYAQEDMPTSRIINSLCNNPINIHVLYTCQVQKEKWEKVLSTY